MDNRVRLARACYLPREAAADLVARCAAALNAYPGETTVVSTTAARLHGLWLPDDLDEIHIATTTRATAGRRMTRTRRPEFPGHRLQVPQSDVTAVHGLPVTTMARTWRALSGVLSLPDLVAAGDSALRLGCTRAELDEVMRRTSRHRFARRARQALGLLDGRSRSRPESHLRVAVSAPDLPPFEVNAAVSRAGGGWLAEPDLSLPEAKLALEYQGSDHAELKRMRKDLTRTTDLRREGWLAYLYGPAEVFGRPWEIAAEVRATIHRRAPHLLSPRVPRVGA